MEDNISIKLQINKNGEGYNTLECFVEINGKSIDIHTDFTEFLLSSKDNRCHYTKTNYPRHKKLEYSSFLPFTCSCGISGCAGIFDGIYTKYRKHSIEWRIPKESGYNRVLDKTFYSFSKLSYQKEIDNLWIFLDDNKDILVYDEDNDGYWNDTTDEWVEEINYIKLSDRYSWLYKE